MDRLLAKNQGAVVCERPKDISQAYQDAAKHLTAQQQNGLYHYSHYPEGVRMNMALGNVPGVTLSLGAQANLRNASDGLERISLPENVILWLGAKAKLLKGFDLLDQKDLRSWLTRSSPWLGLLQPAF